MAISVYTPTFPVSKPTPFVPTTPALLALVQRAVSSYPSEEARIRRGAEIVERDGVRVREDGVYEVGIYHRYPVNGHCPCPDSALGHAPEGHCKHSWSKTFYRKLHAAAAPVVRTKTYVACLDDCVGIATFSEAGYVSFAPYDATLAPWRLSDWEVVYTMVLGRELSASS